MIARMLRWRSLSLAVLLSGCSFTPEYVAPQLPIPQTYPQEVPGGATSIANLGWRTFFHDNELKRLIALALANNRELRIAAARIEAARGAWRIEGSYLYPQLNASGSGTRSRTLVPQFGRYLETSQITAQLATSWEIDFWGKLRNRRNAALEQYLASEEGRRATATQIVSQVAIGYLLEREYEEASELATRSLATRQKSLHIMTRRYEVGAGSQLEVAQARILLAQAQTTLQSLEQDRAVNRNALALLVGKPFEIGSGSLTLAGASPDYVVPVGLPSDLLLNRPDILAAEHQLHGADANIAAARAAFFPNISLTGSFGSASEALEDIFSVGSEIWSFAPSISLPIFTGGALKGNLAVARAQRDEAVATYEKTIQTAFREVSDALVQRRQLALQVETTRDLVTAQTERSRLAQLRFDNGRSAYLEVLDAQRDLFDAEQLLVRLRRAEFASMIALYSALGGGFPSQETRAGRISEEEGRGQ